MLEAHDNGDGFISVEGLCEALSSLLVQCLGHRSLSKKKRSSRSRLKV